MSYYEVLWYEMVYQSMEPFEYNKKQYPVTSDQFERAKVVVNELQLIIFTNVVTSGIYPQYVQELRNCFPFSVQ